MKDVLIILLSCDLSAPWSWVFGKDGSVASSGEAKTQQQKEKLTMLYTSRVVVIIAGQSVRMYKHGVPSMSESDMIKAAAFSIEELTSQSLQDVHCAISDTFIAIISQGEIKSILDVLMAVDIIPDELFADYDVTNNQSIIKLDERFIMPSSLGKIGYALDAQWESEAEDIRQYRELSGVEFLRTIIYQADISEGVNLLQGDYAPNKRQTNWFSPWRRAAVLFAVYCLVFLAKHGLDARAYRLEARIVGEQTSNIYTKLTGLPAPLNPALQMNKKLNTQNKGQNGFLPLSRLLFASVLQTENVSVNSIRYITPKQELQISLSYPSFESAAKLEEIIARSGGRFISGSVRQNDDGFIGDAVVLMERL